MLNIKCVKHRHIVCELYIFVSFFSKRIEDKAVDIHLFRQALESKHHQIWRDAFKNFLLGYKKADDYKEIMLRFEQV